MDEERRISKERIRGLVSQAIKVYNRCGSTTESYDNWTDSFGNGESGVVKRIHEFVTEKNGKPSTKIYNLSYFETEILSLFSLGSQ
jgi:hypothetical protein